MMEKKTVLVLDGETRAALAVVRSLGRAGLNVITGSEYKNSLAGSSRYCSCNVQYPAIANDIEYFSQSIRDLILDKKADVLFPITDATTYAILRNRSLFDEIVSLPFASFQSYWEASNKISLMKKAAELNIPHPSTIFIAPPCSQSIEPYLKKLTFPLILKPQASILSDGKTMKKTNVYFVASLEELLNILSTDESFTAPYMLQKIVVGEGIGIFVFCEKGETVAVFSHRRIREKPPNGGVSVVSESTQPDPTALSSARKLLKALNWSGIAMVEFKRDRARNNIPVLMEINARFWGSLQLSIDAGMNFPLYQYHLSQNTNLGSNRSKHQDNSPLSLPKDDIKQTGISEIITGSVKHTRSRWLLGDLDHLIIRLKAPADHPHIPQRIPDKLNAIAVFLIEFLKKNKMEETRYGDIGPFWYALKKWLKRQ